MISKRHHLFLGNKVSNTDFIMIDFIVIDLIAIDLIVWGI
jgi:hypothetical protein